jgi:hypothetical protein
MYLETALLVSPLAAELPGPGQRADQFTTDVAGGPRHQDHQASSSLPLSRPS